MGNLNNPALAGVTIKSTETEAFNGTSPNPTAWTDLDLSAIVGAKVTFCILKCYNADPAVARDFAIRTNGETEIDTNHTYGFDRIGGLLNVQHGLCAAFTDSAGIVEWSYNNVDQANITIDVVHWINLS